MCVCVWGGGSHFPTPQRVCASFPKSHLQPLDLLLPPPPQKQQQQTFLSIYPYCPTAVSTHLLYYYVASVICPQCPSSHTPCLSIVHRTPLPHACRPSRAAVPNVSATHFICAQCASSSQQLLIQSPCPLYIVLPVCARHPFHPLAISCRPFPPQNFAQIHPSPTCLPFLSLIHI